MKTIANTIYLIFGCAMILSSCQQEETSDIKRDPADRKIVFHTSLPGLATRAGEVTSDNLTYFCLTAFDASDETYKDAENGKFIEYFDNGKIEKTDAAGKFYSDECIWPLPGHEDDEIHFFAYYPEHPVSAELVNNTSLADNTISNKINGFTIEPDIADQVDFITAYTKGTMNKNLTSGINLQFKHQLSRIEVKAKGSGKIFNLEIAGVRFGGVETEGDFIFTADDAVGEWTNIRKKDVFEYIYRPGDKIVSINNVENEVSIMGGSDAVNYAMLIPASRNVWDYSKDRRNEKEGMYIGVLLRVLDKTPGGNNKQQYPYYDKSQGLNALNIQRVFLAVDGSGKVTENPGLLYMDDQGKYFTDKALKTAYTAPAGSTVKEFGWATVPVSGEWQAGYAYTYTLDYTYGVGLHGPEVPGDTAPMAGDPIISDRVGVSLGFDDWKTAEPEDDIVVPGN